MQTGRSVLLIPKYARPLKGLLHIRLLSIFIHSRL